MSSSEFNEPELNETESRIKIFWKSFTESLRDEKLGWQDVLVGLSLASVILALVGAYLEWSLQIVLDNMVQSPLRFALFSLSSIIFFSAFLTFWLAKKISKSHVLVLAATLIYSGVLGWTWADYLTPVDNPAINPPEVRTFGCPGLQVSAQDFQTLRVLTPNNVSEAGPTHSPMPMPRALATAFSKDNKRLALVTGSALCVYTLNQSSSMIQIFHRAITATSFSHDSRFVAVGLEDGTVSVLEIVDTNIQTRWQIEAHNAPITSLKFNANDQWLVSTSSNGVVRAWDTLRAERQFNVDELTYGIADLGFVGNNRLIASDTEGNLYSWDLQFNDRLAQRSEQKLHDSGITALAISGSMVATGDQRGVIRIWNVDSLSNASPIIQLLQHDDAISSLSFNLDGSLIASGSRDTTVVVWDVSSGESLITLLHPSSVYALAFGLDDKLLVSSSADGMLYLWGVGSSPE